MKKYFILLLVLLASPAFAVTSPDGSIQAAVQAAMEASAKTLILPQAIMWLGSFMALQFFITNFGLLKSGSDLDAVFAKLVGSIAWFGVCFYILQNGPEFIDSVGTGMLQKFMPAWISPGYILAAISGVAIALLSTIGLTGLMALGTGSPMISIVVIVVLLVVIAVALGLAMKIFMLKLELGLVVMLSPLSFSFLGLSALKDQGIAPFKALISLVYRAVLLGVICAAFKEVSTSTETALNAIEWGIDPSTWIQKVQIMISSVFAYPMLGYLVYKSDSIAATLASGSTNMGTADIAGAVATGVAAGAVAGGLASAVGANKPIQSMSDFMKSMGGGGGGSVSNASSRGAGGSGSGLLSMPSDFGPGGETLPLNSVSDGSGGASGGSSPTSQQKEFDQALLSPEGKNAVRVENAARQAGASQNVANAASNAAYDMKSPNEIEAATLKAGGSQEQARAAAAASSYAPGDSGIGANISGQNQNADQQAGSKNQNSAGQQFLGHLMDFGRHLEQDKAATHVSINTHHSD